MGLHHATVDLTFPGALGSLMCPCSHPLHTSDPLSSFPELHAAPRLTTCHRASMTNLLLMPSWPKACRKTDSRKEIDLGYQLKSYCLLDTAEIYNWGVPHSPHPPLAGSPFPSQLPPPEAALPASPCCFSHRLHSTAHLPLEISGCLWVPAHPRLASSMEEKSRTPNWKKYSQPYPHPPLHIAEKDSGTKGR